MTYPDEPGYSHGSSGTKPSSSKDYADGDALPSEDYDYFLNFQFSRLKDIIKTLKGWDSNEDYTVDGAVKTSLFKGNDIDSDGDGRVNFTDDTDLLDGDSGLDIPRYSPPRLSTLNPFKIDSTMLKNIEKHIKTNNYSERWNDISIQNLDNSLSLGSEALRKGVTLPDGRIVFAPYRSDYVVEYDPRTNTFTQTDTHGEGDYAFSDASLISDGRVIFAPFNSNSVGIYDPETQTYTSGPSHGKGDGATSASTVAWANNGEYEVVALTPWNSSSHLTYIVKDNSISDLGSNGKTKPSFSDGILTHSGHVLHVPYESNEIVHTYYTDEYGFSIGKASISHTGGSKAFAAGAIGVDGRMVLAPYNHTNIGLVTVTDDANMDNNPATYSDGPTHGETTPAFSSAVTGPDGLVYMGTHNSANIGIYDPLNGTYTSGPSYPNSATNEDTYGATTTLGGNIVLTPQNDTDGAILKLASNVEHPKTTFTHPLFN